MSPSATSVSRWFGVVCLALALAACGTSGTPTGNTVAMKDLEVVDGTATDAMTDLDGVRAEGTAMAPAPAGNSAATASVPEPANNGADTQADEEDVVSDQ